jgi:hypothetical protein
VAPVPDSVFEETTADSTARLRDVIAGLGVSGAVLGAPDLGSGGDVDLIVRDVPRAAQLGAGGARLCQVLHYDVTGWYWIVDVGGKALAIDTLADPRGIGKYAFPVPVDRPRGEGLDLADPSLRTAYLALKRLRKGDRSASAWAYIGRVAAEAPPGSVEELLVRSIGRRAGKILAQAARSGRPPEERVWPWLRLRQRLARIRGPVSGLELLVRMAGRWAERLARPSGLVVLVAGPDGAGKTTLAERLPEALHGFFRRSTRIHFRPGVLPSRGGRAPVTEPHAAAPRGPLASFLYFAYHFTDWFLGGWFTVDLRRRRSDLVVVERGWWDLAVDLRRYRLRVPPPLIRALGWLLVKPDIALLLDAPATVMHARKPELPLDELERQRRAWLELRIPRAERVVLDAARPLEEVVAEAREVVLAHLERRVMRRLGAGWAVLPRGRSPRWWIPRGPRAVAGAGIRVYQPVTALGRIGWEAARILAVCGGFRLLPRGEAPPREVRERLAGVVPRGGTYAVMRANHPGRYVALLIDERGRPAAVAKVATTPEGGDALAAEAEALEVAASALGSRVRVPGIISRHAGVLVTEYLDWRPRRAPWRLAPEIAEALGSLWRATGRIHGDLAPWNVLDTGSGWALVDWESSREEPLPGWDVWHHLIQAHALLGKPGRLEPTAPEVEAVLTAWARGAGVTVEDVGAALPTYLERSLAELDPARPDGRRGIRARERLLAGGVG